MKRNVLFLLAILLLLPASLLAQIPDMKFRRLDTRDGLSSSQVNCIYRDSRGYVWIGTAYGLNRYDGYRIKTFLSNLRDTTTMRDNYVEQIMEDREGKLWLKQGMNYCVYDPLTEKFERNPARELERRGLKCTVERLFIDHQKNFWVKTYDNRIIYYNVKTKKKKEFMVGYDLNQFNPEYGISNIVDFNNNIIIATYNGELICMDGERGLILWENKWMKEHGGPQNQEYRLFLDKNGLLWCASLEMSYIYNTKEERWINGIHQFMAERGITDLPNPLQVWNLLIDNRGWVWLVCDHNGLIVIDYANSRWKQFVNDKQDATTVSDNTLRNIYQDQNGSLWIGTYRNGVNQYVEGMSSIRSLEVGDINTVVEDGMGNYWLGSNERGIIAYNPKTGEQQSYTTANTPMMGNIMVGSCRAHDGSLWFGSYNGGLTHVIPSATTPLQAQVVNYRATENGSGLANNNVWSLTEDRWHRIWIGTLGSGVQMMDPKTGKWRTWNSSNTSLPSNYMTSIGWIKKGWLVVGHGWYYSYINPVTGKVANRVIPEDPNLTVTPSNTVCVMEDSRGLIWQGSSSGVCIYDQKHKRVYLLDMKKGLIGSSVCSILEDKQHAMWAVTDHGVSKVIPQQQEDGSLQFVVRSYNARDGLLNTTFNQRSTTLTHDGLVLVGGQDGLDIIDPAGLSDAKSKERPVFSGLQIFDKDVEVGEEVDGRVILDEALDVCRELDLKFNDQFTIQLASDAGKIGNSKRFVYWLEGFNADWVKTSELNPNITYNSLRAGSYTLHVRMLNDDGTMGEEEATLDITIRPALWRTRWMILLYMLLIAAAALLWRRWFLKRQTRRMQVETRRRELEKQQWMNEMRMQLRQEHQQQQEGEVPHAEAEPVVVDVDREVVDIVPLTRDLCNRYQQQNKDKEVKVNFFCPVEELDVELDEKQWTWILTTLFNNSVQFAHDDCNISVGIVRSKDNKAHIQVADNGIGIRDEYKVHAFDPIVNGEGIGLDRVKAIIDAHGGDIHIEDNPGGGTIFVINLPAAEPDVIDATDLIVEED